MLSTSLYFANKSKRLATEAHRDLMAIRELHLKLGEIRVIGYEIDKKVTLNGQVAEIKGRIVDQYTLNYN